MVGSSILRWPRKDMAGPVDPVTRRLALLLLMLALTQAAAPQVVPQDGPDID